MAEGTGVRAAHPRSAGPVGGVRAPGRVPPGEASSLHRLIELLAVLDVRRRLTYEQIKDDVPAYRARFHAVLASGRGKDDALKDFYGLIADDVAHLRAAGVHVEKRGRTGEHQSIQMHGDLAMKPLELEPMEVLVLSLAIRAWGATSRVGAAGGAAAAARSAEVIAGAGTDSAMPFAGLRDATTTAVGLSTASLAALAEAVDAQRPITFDYRPSGAETGQRRWVDPWGLVRSWGRVYLVGHDRDRREARIFRASRIDGDIRIPAADEMARLTGPAFTTMPADRELDSYVYEVVPASWAEVRVAPAHAGRFVHELGDHAEPVPADDDQGWVAFRVRFWDAAWLAGVLRQYGDHLHVIAPDEVRTLVEDGLAAVADHVAAVLDGGR